jgi:hypothetical protein
VSVGFGCGTVWSLSVGVGCGKEWSLSMGVGCCTGVRVSDVVRNEV